MVAILYRVKHDILKSINVVYLLQLCTKLHGVRPKHKLIYSLNYFRVSNIVNLRCFHHP